MSSTSVFRAVRHSLRKRGIDTGLILSVMGLTAGVLAGALAWGILRGWVLSHRAEVGLKAGPEGRAEEAAQALANRVQDEKFQALWRQAAASEDGLSRDGRLQAEVADAATGEVSLACLGRPPGASTGALARARDLLIDPLTSGIRPLLPPGQAERLADQARRLAEREKSLEDARAREASLRAAKGTRGLEAAAEQLKKEQAEVDLLQKELDRANKTGGDERRRELLGEREKLTTPGDSPSLPTEAEQQKLRDEYVRLERLLRADSRLDSTASHPIVRRMNEIGHRLKLADLTRKIAECEGGQEKIKALQSRLSGALARRDAAAREAGKGDQEQKAIDAASNDTARIEGEVRALRAEDESLKQVPSVPVQVAATGGIAETMERGWLVWPCLGGGLAAGLLLAVLLKHVVLARYSLINSRSGLAHCLHVPVLGVVPDLASISAQRK